MPKSADRTPAEKTAYPDELRRAELDRFQRAAHRRGAEPSLGVGLSGGGIRSATFALGAFQAWARRAFVRRIDVLSTVSGGGYFGAFLGRLFARDYVKSPADAEKMLHADSQVIGWLRENGRYLSPRGSGDLLLMAAALFRNWLAINSVLAFLALWVFLLLQWPRRWAEYVWPEASMGHTAWVWWSPWLALSIIPIAFLPSLIGGYWLVYPDPRRWFGIAGCAAASIMLIAFSSMQQPEAGVRMTLGWVMLATTLLAVVSAFAVGTRDQVVARNRITDLLKNLLIASGAFVVLGLIDTMGQTAYAAIAEGRFVAWIVSLTVGLGGIATFARQIVVLFGPSTGGKRLRVPGTIIAGSSAVMIVALMATTYNAVAHAIAWGFQQPFVAGSTRPDALLFSMWCTAAFLVACGLGRSWTFVNQSTHQPIYQARLTRAYLGASNPARWTGAGVPVIDPLPDDDASMEAYWNTAAIYEKGAPLHIVNTTINETFDGKSQVEQLDRKGVGLAVGPGGMSAGVRHHVVWGLPDSTKTEGFRVFEYAGERPTPTQPMPGESLSLGQWVGISGAAFSTGLGARTSIGLSVLAGLLNVRLGYWWDSKIALDRRRNTAVKGRVVSDLIGKTFEAVFPVQKFLCSELIARFPGVARRYWHLSDGGHFENLGGYELIRRRLDLMIVVDAEEDEQITFQGLGNLIRKARVDFGAHIEFLDQGGLRELGCTCTSIGSLNDLRRFDGLCSLKHAALATVRYDDEPEIGTEPPKHFLLYLKPTLTGDEPADLIEYGRLHPAFPHESTADQFFDEAQWESYRALGDHIACVVFDDIRANGPDWLKQRCGFV